MPTYVCCCASHLQDGVDREIKAVDSEHSKNLNTDAWRQHQLYKATANQEHPWAKFSTGAGGTIFGRFMLMAYVPS